MDYLNKINNTRVSPKILSEILSLFEEMSPEDRPSFEDRILCIFDFLRNKGIERRRCVALSMAIQCRIQALGLLRSEPAYRGWAILGVDSASDTIHYNLLRVAAVLPLQDNGSNDVCFDISAFRERLLKISSIRGRG